MPGPGRPPGRPKNANKVKGSPIRSPVKTGQRGRPRLVIQEPTSDEGTTPPHTNDSGDDTDDSIAYLSANRQKRLRTVDVTKEVMVIHPDDDVEELLGLASHEIDEFNEFLETSDDVYLYEGREVTADEPTNGSKPAVVFTPRISVVSDHVSTPSPERVEAFFKRQKELEKELIPKPIVIPPIAPVVQIPDPNVPRGRGRPRLYPISAAASAAQAAAAHKAAVAAAVAAAKSKKVNFGETVNKNSYTVYDADEEDESFLANIRIEKGVSRQQLITLEEFEEMIAALERALEIAKEGLPHISKLMDLKRLCKSFIIESNEVASFAHNSVNGVKEGEKGYVEYKISDDLMNSEDFGVYSTDASGDALRAFTREELEELVPETEAILLLNMISNAYSEKLKRAVPVVQTPQQKARAIKVYNHWLDKRANRKCSLVRCYHNFIMDMWKRQEIVPKIPDDADEKAWKVTRQHLLRIRADLDRARLIMDRLRRREKVKRELNIAAIDAFDDFDVVSSSGQDIPEDEMPKPLPFEIEYLSQEEIEIENTKEAHFTNSFISSRTVEDNFGSDVLNSSHISGSGWTPIEDKLLLLGVAAYGIGSWSKIRDLFHTSKTSIYMNQRFQRLTRQRHIKYGSGQDIASRTAAIGKLGVPAVIVGNESGLSPNLQRFINSFQEDAIWEGIAVRHILESHNPEKRCGRPSKNPVRIPIPKHISVLDLKSLMDLGKKFTYDPNMVYGDTPVDAITSSSSGDIKVEDEITNGNKSKSSSSSSSTTVAATDDEDEDVEDNNENEDEGEDGGEDDSEEDDEDFENGKDSQSNKKRGAKSRCSLSSLPNTKSTKSGHQKKGNSLKRNRDTSEKVAPTKRKSERLH